MSTKLGADPFEHIHAEAEGRDRRIKDDGGAYGYPALRILGGGEGVKSAGDQEHAEPVVVVVGEAAGDPAGEFDEPVHGLGAAVG